MTFYELNRCIIIDTCSLSILPMITSDITVAFASTMLLGECPVWNPEAQLLYWIDIPGSTLHQLDPVTHQHRHWPLASEPGCIACCASGGIIIAMRHGIEHFSPLSGQFTPLVQAPYDQDIMRFNDGRCDSAGRFVLGTIYEPRDKTDALLYSFSKGKLHPLGPRATVSNGVAFSPDNRRLYHSDTSAHQISVYDYDLVSGAVSNQRLFQQFSKDKSTNYAGRPDGSAVDSEGAYWCAMFEGGALLRFSPDGELLLRLPLPVKCPTMLAFGGADLKTLFITTARHNRPAAELEQCPLSGHLLKVSVAVAGLNEHAYLM